jgi:hypothetical protein
MIIADVKIESVSSTNKSSIPAFYSVYRSRNMLSEEEIKVCLTSVYSVCNCQDMKCYVQQITCIM